MEIVGTFWALVPPLMAIVLALFTKKTFSSLFVGILVGAILLACQTGNPVSTLSWIVSNSYMPVGADIKVEVGLIPSLANSAGIFVFLVTLGMMVTFIGASGSSAAFGAWAARHVKSRRGALLATFFLSTLFFIDDYFNCLTVGVTMRSVTDAQKISRAKLSYIIDATAVSVCILAPVSSWAAAVSDTANSLNAGINGIQLFISTIPFNFYSLLTIFFIVAISCLGFDYGSMAKAELKAYQEGELGLLDKENISTHENAVLIDMFLPILVLIVMCVTGMLYVGGFWDPASGYAGNVIGAFGNTNAGVALSWGSIAALVFTFVYFRLRRLITGSDATNHFVEGFRIMISSMLILIFALTLKSITVALGAAEFVSSIMVNATHIYSILPALIFLMSLGLAFATGTSWGTFGILIPLVVVIFPADSALLTIGTAACLAGAVCGDHLSPISDTTVMSSAGANVDHIQHVTTQIPYALTVAAVSLVCFLIAGFVQNWIICWGVGIALLLGALLVLRATIGKKIGA